jgi:3',5'-cyclic AMP phosphodiesterase CpdA
MDNPSRPALRLAHLSDIHITAEPLGWSRGDWLSKRVTGWINLRWMGRRRRFGVADEVLAAIHSELRRRRPEHVVFSGDATALGFEVEFARASEYLGVRDHAMPPGLAVPGNHDYYTPAVAASGLFEKYFAPWQAGERVGDATYPFAQRVGLVWLIGVNSCTGNVWPWDAAGTVGIEQLERLEELLGRLGPGPRILVTHYPVCQATGKPERHSHGLRDLSELLSVASRGGICLWLHGHQHGPYRVCDPGAAPFPVICAGSATQRGDWSYNEYTIQGRRLHAVRRVYRPEEHSFREVEEFDVELPE